MTTSLYYDTSTCIDIEHRTCIISHMSTWMCVWHYSGTLFPCLGNLFSLAHSGLVLSYCNLESAKLEENHIPISPSL